MFMSFEDVNSLFNIIFLRKKNIVWGWQMVSFENRILRIRALYISGLVHAILKAPYLFLLEVFHNLLEAFIFRKIAKPIRLMKATRLLLTI